MAKKSKQATPTTGDAGSSKLTSFFSWLLSFLIGSGILATWLSGWNSIDEQANIVIDVISKADGTSPQKEDIDSYLSISSVFKKAKFIRETQSKIHSDSRHSYFANRDDFRWYDREGWKTAVNSYKKIEENLHPKIYKQVAWNSAWSSIHTQAMEVSTNPHALTALTKLPGEVLSQVFDESDNSFKNTRIEGVFVDSIPKGMDEANYPYIDLHNPKTKELLDKLPAKLNTNKRYFVPSYNELPASATGEKSRPRVLDAPHK